MPDFEYGQVVQGGGPDPQDRVAVVETAGGLFVAVADGAGGTSHGGRAADLVVAGLRELAGRGGPVPDEPAWEEFLAEMDCAIARDPEPGETTAVVLAVTASLICGASVGDSEAWLIAPAGWHDLTARQRRKPLLGSRAAVPVSFRSSHAGGTLLVGSVGLFKYAPAPLLRETAPRGTPRQACGALVDLARLPGGGLQDDVSVVVCRLSRP